MCSSDLVRDDVFNAQLQEPARYMFRPGDMARREFVFFTDVDQGERLLRSVVTGDGIRALAFQVRDRIGSGVGAFGSVTDGKASVIVFVSEDLVERGVSAGDLASAGAKALGGGGSRDPKLAQAGGPNADGIDEAVTLMRTAAHAALARL